MKCDVSVQTKVASKNTSIFSNWKGLVGIWKSQLYHIQIVKKKIDMGRKGKKSDLGHICLWWDRSFTKMHPTLLTLSISIFICKNINSHWLSKKDPGKDVILSEILNRG